MPSNRNPRGGSGDRGRRRPSQGSQRRGNGRSQDRGKDTPGRDRGKSGAPAPRNGKRRDAPRRGGQDSRGAKGRSQDRPPVKGRRRTFDEPSAPTERERERLARDTDDRDDRWIDEGPVRRAADEAAKRAKSGGSNRKRKEQRAAKRAEGALEVDRRRLQQRLGDARAQRTIQRLGEASTAFGEERYDDARKLLEPIVKLVPEEPAVHELYGLTLYRLGRWNKAITELEEFHRQTGSTEQHPVLADCHRAKGRHARVAELWEEIGEESLAAAIVAEGRIVYAGSLADQGKVTEAIDLLEAAPLGAKRLQEHHLRLRYVLADLYDRAGDHQAARRIFQSIADVDPGYYDVRERLTQL